jgi:ATP-dependent HslUV protease subunit HslV
MLSKSIKLSSQLCKGPKNVFSFTERMYSSSPWHGTTILCVRKDGKVVMAGDGQVSQGASIVKGTAVKVRRIGIENDVLVGFAGSVADALTLRERLEKKIEEYPGQLPRACVELAKDWRSDKYMKDLEVSCPTALEFVRTY